MKLLPKIQVDEKIKQEKLHSAKRVAKMRIYEQEEVDRLNKIKAELQEKEKEIFKLHKEHISELTKEKDTLEDDVAKLEARRIKALEPIEKLEEELRVKEQELEEKKKETKKAKEDYILSKTEAEESIERYNERFTSLDDKERILAQQALKLEQNKKIFEAIEGQRNKEFQKTHELLTQKVQEIQNKQKELEAVEKVQKDREEYFKDWEKRIKEEHKLVKSRISILKAYEQTRRQQERSRAGL